MAFEMMKNKANVVRLNNEKRTALNMRFDFKSLNANDKNTQNMYYLRFNRKKEYAEKKMNKINIIIVWQEIRWRCRL